MLEQVVEELREVGIEGRIVSWGGAGGDAIVFRFDVPVGRCRGEQLQLGLSFQEDAYPEYPPHFIHVCARRLRGTDLTRHSKHDFDGAHWWAFSAPPRDFWDDLNPAQKNMRTYVWRHLLRFLEEL